MRISGDPAIESISSTWIITNRLVIGAKIDPKRGIEGAKRDGLAQAGDRLGPLTLSTFDRAGQQVDIRFVRQTLLCQVQLLQGAGIIAVPTIINQGPRQVAFG